jgi:hypothetical protein
LGGQIDEWEGDKMTDEKTEIGRKCLDRLFEFINSTEEQDLVEAKNNLYKRIDNAIKFNEPIDDWDALMGLVNTIEKVKERFK